MFPVKVKGAPVAGLNRSSAHQQRPVPQTANDKHLSIIQQRRSVPNATAGHAACRAKNVPVAGSYRSALSNKGSSAKCRKHRPRSALAPLFSNVAVNAKCGQQSLTPLHRKTYKALWQWEACERHVRDISIVHSSASAAHATGLRRVRRLRHDRDDIGATVDDWCGKKRSWLPACALTVKIVASIVQKHRPLPDRPAIVPPIGNSRVRVQPPRS